MTGGDTTKEENEDIDEITKDITLITKQNGATTGLGLDDNSFMEGGYENESQRAIIYSRNIFRTTNIPTTVLISDTSSTTMTFQNQSCFAVTIVNGVMEELRRREGIIFQEGEPNMTQMVELIKIIAKRYVNQSNSKNIGTVNNPKSYFNKIYQSLYHIAKRNINGYTIVRYEYISSIDSDRTKSDNINRQINSDDIVVIGLKGHFVLAKHEYKIPQDINPQGNIIIDTLPPTFQTFRNNNGDVLNVYDYNCDNIKTVILPPVTRRPGYVRQYEIISVRLFTPINAETSSLDRLQNMVDNSMTT